MSSRKRYMQVSVISPVVHPVRIPTLFTSIPIRGERALGSAVVLGHIWFAEVDTYGSILSQTVISPKFSYDFAPAGQDQVSDSVDICYLTDSGHDLWASRFAHCGTSRYLDYTLRPLPTGATGIWRDARLSQESTFPWCTVKPG